MVAHCKDGALLRIVDQFIIIRNLAQFCQECLEVLVVHTEYEIVSVELMPEAKTGFLLPRLTELLSQVLHYLLHVYIEECWAER